MSLDEVDAKWPLIRYIMDDDVYAQKYAEAVDEFINEVFITEEMYRIFDTFAELIEDYVRQEGGDQAVGQMYAQVQQLKTHVTERIGVAEEYLVAVQ